MLDEIGEMSPAIQAKFLRVLEGHPFERVGGTEPVKVDVRVIAATNRDLERDVVEGRFRRDLYFRLRVLEIVVPGLRKRPEDIPELAEYFLQKFNAETGRKLRGFTPAAIELMRQVSLAGQRPRVEERRRAGRRAGPRRIHRARRPDALADRHRRRHRRHARPSAAAFHPSSLADMERQHILATLDLHRLEQEPDGQPAGHRALDARPQDPPLRDRGRAAPRAALISFVVEVNKGDGSRLVARRFAERAGCMDAADPL